MELVLRYLENAVRFRNLAVAESNPKLKAELEKQAETYHRLAVERAKERDLPLPHTDA